MGHKFKKSEKNGSITEDKTTFFYHAFRNILLLSVPLTIISAVLLSVPHSSADNSSTDDITLKLDVACTVSSVVSSPHSALDMHVGQYKADIGNTNISVFCNDNNGYSVYAVGNSNSIDGNTDLISNISSNYNIHTGTNSSSGNSSWAMKLAAGTGSGSETTPPTIVNGYNSYSIVPNNYTLVATRPSGTSMNPDSSVSGSYFSTTYAIYAASTQPAGTYNGKVKYVMVHPDNSTHNTIPDIDTAFAAAGKMKVYEEGNNSYYAMQDMDSQICSLVGNSGEVTATQLVDLRDNNLYWVAKLEDGKCWMTQNLDLDIDATRTYTHNDTDLGWDTNNFDTNATWTPDTTNGKYNLPVNGTSVPSWSNQNNYPYSADPGDMYYYTSNSASDDIKYTSLSTCITAGHTEGECKHYHAGNYYNWTAAIASNNSSALTQQYTNAPNSICPKGWRLPIATNADQSIYEFGELLYEQGITKTKTDQGTGINYVVDGFNNIRKSPLWLMRGGQIGNGILSNASMNGLYLSSAIRNNSAAYAISFTNVAVWPAGGNDNSKSLGRSIRCLAR